MRGRKPFSVDGLRECAKNGTTVQEAAVLLGRSEVWVRYSARKHGISLATKRDVYAERLREHAERGLSSHEIARLLGISVNAVKGKACRHGIKLSSKPRRVAVCKPKIRVYPTAKQTAIANYGRASASQIAYVTGLSRNAVIGYWYRSRHSLAEENRAGHLGAVTPARLATMREAAK